MLRAVVKAQIEGLADIQMAEDGTSIADAVIQETKFYFEGEWFDATIYERSKIGIDIEVPGPAIIQEMDSTTVILPNHKAMVDSVGNLLINPSN